MSEPNYAIPVIEPFIAEIPEDFDKKWIDYKNNSDDIQLSLICSTIKDFNFIKSMYNTIVTKLNFEIIFISPNEPCDMPDNCKWIKVGANIKILQCCQIGIFHARGETISLCADDQVFSPYAWDEAYNIYKESNDYKTIVSLRWFIPKYGHVTFSGLETDLNKFDEFTPSSKYGDILIPTSVAIINKKYFLELGGFDTEFIRQEACEDFFLRAMLNGTIVKFTLYGRVFEYGHLYPLATTPITYLHVYQDFARTGLKWKVEDGKLIQNIPTPSYIFDETIYTINQGATFGKWVN